MWTGNKENEEYTAQISPYHGQVHAEILSKKYSQSRQSPELWLNVMEKSFGKNRNNEPTQLDWENANKWVETQMTLIKKFGTVLVTRPKKLTQ